jgi:hypothetical protein
MLFGNRNTDEPEVAYCIILAGQSNNDGSAISERLLGDFGYKGILDGYPLDRTALNPVPDLYDRTPSGVYIYNLQRTDDNLWYTDDGVWEAYEATNNGNARNRAVRNSDGRYGAELGAAVQIADYTGKEVFIVKPAWGATALAQGDTGASLPGPWLYQCLHLHGLYIQRAVRDFATFRPGVRLKVVHWHWWQGERDATQGRTQAQYYNDLNTLMPQIRRHIYSHFVIQVGQEPLFQFTKLKANETAAEDTISAAIEQYVNEHADARFLDVDGLTGEYFPKLEDLTVAEQDPLPLNSGPYPDDLHASHIYVDAVGELTVLNDIAAGLLQAA